MSNPLHVFLIAGEHSGDQLGFKLMQELRRATGGAVRFSGIGGHAMEQEGLKSLFPLEQRMEWLRQVFGQYPTVGVDQFQNLTAHYCQRIGAR